jgi:hypothetical protein
VRCAQGELNLSSQRLSSIMQRSARSSGRHPTPHSTYVGDADVQELDNQSAGLSEMHLPSRTDTRAQQPDFGGDGKWDAEEGHGGATGREEAGDADTRLNLTATRLAAIASGSTVRRRPHAVTVASDTPSGARTFYLDGESEDAFDIALPRGSVHQKPRHPSSDAGGSQLTGSLDPGMSVIWGSGTSLDTIPGRPLRVAAAGAAADVATATASLRGKLAGLKGIGGALCETPGEADPLADNASTRLDVAAHVSSLAKMSSAHVAVKRSEIVRTQQRCDQAVRAVRKAQEREEAAFAEKVSQLRAEYTAELKALEKEFVAHAERSA